MVPMEDTDSKEQEDPFGQGRETILSKLFGSEPAQNSSALIPTSWKWRSPYPDPGPGPGPDAVDPWNSSQEPS